MVRADGPLLDVEVATFEGFARNFDGLLSGAKTQATERGSDYEAKVDVEPLVGRALADLPVESNGWNADELEVWVELDWAPTHVRPDWPDYVPYLVAQGIAQRLGVPT